MTRFCFSSLLALALFVSCGAVQSQRPDTTILSGTRFDVDLNGNLFVVESEKNVLRKFSKEHALQKEIGGTGWGDDQFDHPSGVWARNGIDVFVADYGNHRIQRFDRNLAFISSFSTRDRPNTDVRPPDGRASFGYPTDVAISRLGDLFICDSENSRILKVVGQSQVQKAFGGFDAGKGRLRKPSRIEIGPNDNVYVLDAMPAGRQGNRVVEFDNFGNFVRVIGEGLFQNAIHIFSDESGLIVLDDTKLFFFDRDDRLVLDVQFDSLLKIQQSNVRAFAFSRGVGYFLTSQGMLTAADPRVMQLHQSTK